MIRIPSSPSHGEGCRKLLMDPDFWGLNSGLGEGKSFCWEERGQV